MESDAVVSSGDRRSGTVHIPLDEGVAVLHVDRAGPGDLPRLRLEKGGPTFGLTLRTHRCTAPVPGLHVEVLRTGLFGDEFPAGAAVLPDHGAPGWLSAPERSDAGRILSCAVEALSADVLPHELIPAPVAPPRGQVRRVGAWDAVSAPNGLTGGLPAGERPTEMHRMLGGTWMVTLDDAPGLPLEARVWLAHRERDVAGEVLRWTATWHGPGADQPWHVEMHIAHRPDEQTTEFLVIDGSTGESWELADAVHTPGTPLTWRVHPAPQPDQASRTGEAMYALITALAQACSEPRVEA